MMRYVRNKEIDRASWDRCVDKSSSPLIYGHSFFLDSMIKNWDAVIINDYEAVFPLPWKIKYGIPYLYYPPFTQQLGLFSAGNKFNIDEVLALVKTKFKYGDLCLNFTNLRDKRSSAHTNFILSLDRSYGELSAGYKKDLKKNLKKTANENWNYSDRLQIKKAVDMYRSEYAGKLNNIKPKDYKNFESLCNGLVPEKKVFTRSVADINDRILAIALFLFDGKRIYNVMNTSTGEGRVKEANHFLLDRVIHEFAGTGCVLDFEGSDIEGVKKFYGNFRPVNQPYFTYSFNHLPALVKLIKK